MFVNSSSSYTQNQWRTNNTSKGFLLTQIAISLSFLCNHICPLLYYFLYPYIHLSFTLYSVLQNKMHDKYVEAISKLKDDTSPKICVTLTGHSQTKDITKHLLTNNQMIIAQYTKKGQPYLQAVLTEEDSTSASTN